MLGCGCGEAYVTDHGRHHVGCRWPGAAASSYPGVQEWQAGLPDGEPARVVEQARRERAPWDAVYPIGGPNHLWQTVSRAERVIPDIPAQRSDVTSQATA